MSDKPQPFMHDGYPVAQPKWKANHRGQLIKRCSQCTHWKTKDHYQLVFRNNKWYYGGPCNECRNKLQRDRHRRWPQEKKDERNRHYSEQRKKIWREKKLFNQLLDDKIRQHFVTIAAFYKRLNGLGFTTTYSMIYHWRNGIATPNPEYRQLMAVLLHVKEETLFPDAKIDRRKREWRHLPPKGE